MFGLRRRSEGATRPIDSDLPRGMLLAGAWSWRILAIAGVVALFIFLVIEFRVIVIPMLVAIIVSALLVPFSEFLQRHRWPRWLAIATTLVVTVGAISSLVYLVVTQVRAGWPDLQAQSLAAWDRLTDWLLASPLHVTEEQIAEWAAGLWEGIQRDSSVWINGALTVGSTAGHLVAGALIAIFAILLILIDGKNIWAWFVRIFPRNARVAIDGAGQAGWVTLSNFGKVQVFVAAVDAVGIGLGAFFLGLPLAVPLAIVVFLGSFIPIVGAVATGAIAVLIALIYKDLVIAIIMLAIVIVVQQVESHVLQPLVMGQAVKVHPLAVVLAVAAGSYIAGIAGALFAVPIVATANAVIGYIGRGGWRKHPHPDLDDVLASD
ncbi:MAG: AI-2E family transporter [Cryobacterium sp.]|nr:AI-2E family transporter [Cryobacterium sp.]